MVAGAAALRMLRPAGRATGDGDGAAGAGGGAGAGLGAVTGVLGVGGGFLAVPALVTRAGPADAGRGGYQPAGHHRQLAGRAGDPRAATVEQLDWAVVGPFAGAAILGAWDGKRLAAKVPGHAAAADFRRAAGRLLARGRASCSSTPA